MVKDLRAMIDQLGTEHTGGAGGWTAEKAQALGAAARDRALVVLADNATDAAELELFIDMLGLWPEDVVIKT